MALEDLKSFTGSEHFYRHNLNRKFVYTDGVKYVAKEGGAYWLIDEIALAIAFNPALKGEDFQSWTLTKTGNRDGAKLMTDDGNGNVLYTKEIEFTDFPLHEIKFFVVSAEDFGEGVMMLMLPSEY